MRFCVFCIILLVFAIKVHSQINTPPNPTKPFGSNTTYAFGIRPTNLPSGGTFGSAQDAADAYNTWKANYVESCGGNPIRYRVKFDNAYQTVSEGIAYGMMVAAYAADKALFDGLWLYYKSFMNTNGLMHWRIDGCAGISGTGSATDADLDAALALRVAMIQWPTTSSYATDLSVLLEKIRLHDIQTSTEPGPFQTNNGDQWLANSDCRNPGYQSPAYYKVFADFEPSQASYWTSVENASYTLINNNVHPSTGLVSNWSGINGLANSCNGPNEYGWDACRYPWRMATDVIWYNNANAVARCASLASYVQSTGVPNLRGPVSVSGGSGSYHSPAFVSTWACGLMGASSNFQSLLNSAYTETKNVQDGLPYYFGNTLRLIMMFQMTGNFWNPATATTTNCTATTLALDGGSNASICNGTSISRTVTATGGTSPYAFTWSSGLGTGATKTLNPTSTTTYTVTVSDNLGCTKTASFVVTVNSAPSISITGNTFTCNVGTTTLTASGGTSYAWSNGVSTASITVGVGNYTVTVTGSNGCTSTATRSINNTNISASITGNTFVCNGGTSTLTASGGTSYAWSNGASTASITVGVGNYTVTVTGSNGCNSTATRSINNTIVSASITGNTFVCNGGTSTLTASGGTSYAWSNGASTASIIVGVGNYTVTVTGSNGCTSTATRSINNTNISASITGNTFVCNGGTSTLTASGGNSYVWSNGASTASITVGAGNYTVTVTGSNGCTSTATRSINNTNVSASITGNAFVCNGGTSTLTASGGNSYVWSNGASTASITVGAGNYTVTVTGSNGCTSTVTRSINNTNVSASITGNTFVCNGGTSTLTAIGGTSYAWSNGASTASITVGVGNYTVTVTGSNGCTSTATRSINNTNVSASITGNSIVCNGGTSTLTASGGTTYAWSNGASTASITVGVGNYTITVTESNGCTSTATRSINNINVSASITGNTFVCNGAITTLNASGGTSYVWSNGANTAVISVAAGTYTVTVTGANNCTSIASHTINNTLINASITGNTFTCNGGTTTLTASGGNTYVWSNSATTPEIEVALGTYAVTVTGNNNCTATSSVIVTGSPTASIIGNSFTCNGGTTTLTVSGGTSFLWSNNETTASVIVGSGTHSVTVTTSNGCTAVASMVVDNTNIVASISGNNFTCNGQNTLLQASGGNSYTWSNGLTVASILVPAGNYTVTVTGNNACSTTSSISIDNTNLSAIITGNSYTCNDGNTSITASGGLSYQWSNGANTPTINVGAGTYIVTVSSVNQCTGTAMKTINNTNVTASIIGNDFACNGQSTSLIASGGNSYLWSNGVNTALNSVFAGEYSVTVTGENGCTSNVTKLVNENSLLSASLGDDVSLCAGNSAVKSATANGGTAPYSFIWNHNLGSGSTKTLSPASTTTYIVTITDAIGCSATSSFVLTILDNPIVTVNEDLDLCLGQNAILNANGADQYNWNTGHTGQMLSINPTVTTVYTVTGTNAFGCVGSDQVVVSVRPLPIVNVGPDVFLQIGQSVILTASGASSYLWSTGSTSNAILVEPQVTTTYHVTGTNIFGCSATDETVVNVNQMQVLFGSNGAICQGDLLVQTVSAIGGSSPYTYVWNQGLGSGSSKVLSPEFTTTYVVTATDANGNTSTASFTLQVNALPSVSAGVDQSICFGQSAQLLATGASSYSWSNGSNTANITLSPSTTTTYTVTGTNANGCSASDSVLVTVHPSLTASLGNNVNICLGSSYTASANVNGGSAPYTILWSSGFGTGPSKLLSPITTSAYQITVTDVQGCSAISSLEVQVLSLPIINAGPDVVIQPGETATLTASGGVNYVWNTGSTDASISINPEVSSTYTVTATDSNGCQGSDQVMVIVGVLLIDVGDDVTSCQGSSFLRTVTATGGQGPYTFNWNNGLDIGNTKTVTVTSNTTYTVTVTDSNNNTAIGSFNVSMLSNPELSLGADATICRGASTTKTANAIGGLPPYTFTWSHGLGSGATKVLTPSITTLYQVTVTDNNGCTMSTSTTVNVASLPNAQIVAHQNNLFSVYTDPSNLVTGSWVSSGTLNQINNESPFEGSNHYKFIGNVGNWAGYGLNISNWSTTGRNFSPYQTLRLAYRGLTGSQTMKIKLRNSNGIGVEFSNTVDVGQSVSTYSIVNIPISSFINGTNFNISNVTEINISVEDNNPSSTSTLYLDAIQLVGTSSPTTTFSNCDGNGGSLTASGGTSYFWNTGATTNVIAVNPPSTTTYTVTATNTFGCNSSTSVTIVSGALTTPTNVSASDGAFANRVEVSWTGVACNFYRVFRNTVDNASTATAISAWSSTPNFSDVNAVAGTLYYYWVRSSFNTNGTNPSAFSAVNTGHRLLTSPVNVAATDGTSTTSVTVSWTRVSGTFYRVYRNTTNTTTGATELGTSWSSTSSFNDATAIAGTVYFYWVKASRNSNGSLASDFSVSNSGFRGIPTTVPTNVVATDGTFKSKVDISWSGTSGNFFRVFRSNTNTSSNAVAISNWMNTMNFSDANVTQGVVYFYFVRSASNNIGSNMSGFSAGNAGNASSTGAKPIKENENEVVQKSKINLNIYPNPTISTFSANWKSEHEQYVIITILDANGIIVHQQKVLTVVGQNDWENRNLRLKNGTYWFKISNSVMKVLESKQFIVLE